MTFLVDIENSNGFFLFPSTFFRLSRESRVFVSEAEARQSGISNCLIHSCARKTCNIGVNIQINYIYCYYYIIIGLRRCHTCTFSVNVNVSNVFFSFFQPFPPASSPCESVGSRAGFIYVSDISFPSLKIIYIISVIIGLRRRHTNTFSINIEGLDAFFLFPSNFSVCIKSVRWTCNRLHRVKFPPIFS